jgi:5-hydroxyisourate hydrolase-like protein (transthyretin family)
MSGYISTHVLNLVSGKPGANIAIRLLFLETDGKESGTRVPSWKQVAQAKTNS